ncbi:MAG: hypothetical protein GW873_02570 [Nitrospirae bacterium]|nr:hypothetical protein [Nitrospirota bacterium]
MTSRARQASRSRATSQTTNRGNVEKYKEQFRKERAKYFGASELYRAKEFTISEDKRFCICPAGKRLYRNGSNVILDRNTAIKFRSRKTDCRVCEVRERCLRNPDTSEVRQVCFLQGRVESISETFTEKGSSGEINPENN